MVAECITYSGEFGRDEIEGLVPLDFDEGLAATSFRGCARTVDEPRPTDGRAGHPTPLALEHGLTDRRRVGVEVVAADRDDLAVASVDVVRAEMSSE